MLLEEAPIAVDTFNHPGPEQGGPQIFFCSHAHDDHLKGLGKKWRKGRLFASEVTGRLLKLRWPQLDVTVLQMEQVHTISLKSGLEIQVYLIDANHVPGSVMFLFSGYFGSVLYTGDFRLHSQHAEICSLQMLRDKELSRIYLDNTYCDPRFCQPPRADVAKAILRRLKKKWPCIVFISSYKLGKEELLLQLCRKLRTKLVVSEERCRGLAASGAVEDPAELERLVQRRSEDPAKWPEELLYRESLTGCIWLVSRANLRKAMLRASDSGAAAHGVQASGWAEQRRKSSELRPSFEDDEHCLVSDDGICSFSYSDHSSYLELVQFLQFLPAVPVTFLTPLRHVESEFSYDGHPGMFQLLEDTGVPSIRHYDQGASRDHYRPSGEVNLRRAPKRGHPEDRLEGSGVENGGG